MSTRVIHRACMIGLDGLGSLHGGGGYSPWIGSALSDFATVDVSGAWDPNFKPIIGPGTYTRELGSCETFTDHAAWEDPADAFALVWAYKGDVVHARAALTGYFDNGGVGTRYSRVRLSMDANYASGEHVDAAMEGTIVRFDAHQIRTPAALFGSAIVPVTGWCQIRIQGTVSASGADLQLTDAVSIHVDVSRRGAKGRYVASLDPIELAEIAAVQAASSGPWNVPE